MFDIMSDTFLDKDMYEGLGDTNDPFALSQADTTVNNNLKQNETPSCFFFNLFVCLNFCICFLVDCS